MKNWNKEKYTCCPHCQGNTGFEVFNIVRHSETISWNGEVISVDGKTITAGKNLRCIDCGKSVGKQSDFVRL